MIDKLRCWSADSCCTLRTAIRLDDNFGNRMATAGATRSRDCDCQLPARHGNRLTAISCRSAVHLFCIPCATLSARVGHPMAQWMTPSPPRKRPNFSQVANAPPRACTTPGRQPPLAGCSMRQGSALFHGVVDRARAPSRCSSAPASSPSLSAGHRADARSIHRAGRPLQ